MVRAAKVSYSLGLAMVVAVLPPVLAASGPRQGEQTPGASPTFTRDVLPILQKSCQGCHHPGTSAPMPLVTYQDVRPWARAIKQKTGKREMPPWTADAPHGVFKNDPRLSQKEIDTIAAWVDAGAPRGDVRDLPPAPTFAASSFRPRRSRRIEAATT